jgi:hypothetical protein
MRSKLWTALVPAACVAACAETQVESPRAAGEQRLPVDCDALQGLPSAVLVDDFEDGDELLDPAAGLRGLWYVENDGTGTQSPPAGERPQGSLLAEPGAPGSSRHALRSTARGFRDWGAFVGVRLNAARTMTCTVDASASSGLSFLARGNGGVRVNFGTPRTTPLADNGECDSENCSDFGAAVALEDTFRAYELRFDELQQPDWATKAEWEPTRLVRLSFWAEQSSFDLWLDELRLF